ncbi:MULTISPECIES: hypothetical protein [unclassified Pseudomonas]|uniref:hypothetical protein n=1 Tax=unclassified Pseudomonas TaxID=196821 RepID=UPI000C2FF232|nr:MULTISPECIES: hypothetical protein [unclassified Pseudomonas]MCU1737990.1 hypothetical protein [Pseudomonas sp. 20S_6.2_Bac1]
MMDQYEENIPASYSSADEAISEILKKDSPSFYSSSHVNWDAAAIAIKSAKTISFDAKTFLALVKRATPFSARAFYEFLEQWGFNNWAVVRDVFIQEAVKNFAAKYGDNFVPFVKQWSRLKGDALLLNSLIVHMRNNLGELNTYLPRLVGLQHGRAEAQRVMAVVMDAPYSVTNRDELAEVIELWAGDSRWGRLHVLLWKTSQKSDSQFVPVSGVERVSRLLKEFGILSSPSNYRLSELSAESRASWRRELKVAVESDSDLLEATAETLLGLGSPADDRGVLFAVLELYDDSIESGFSSFLSHPNELVRRRARAAIDMFRFEPDISALPPLVAASAGYRNSGVLRSMRKPRTWIGDARIETLIEDVLEDAAKSAGDQIVKNLHSGEETHVMVLLGELKIAFRYITTLLEDLAAEGDSKKRLSFELDIDYRVVGKKEEGGKGVGTTKSFSTDVCLLIELRDGGKQFSRRVSLLQAKRMFSPDKKRPYFPIKQKQLENLSAQTMASFLMLLGPECDGVNIPIIPARLMVDLIARGERSTQLAPTRASELGKGIGTWFVEDVIGLWTGDWEKNIVARAEGGKYREPLIVARLIVDQIPKGPDGWSKGRRL